MGNFYSYVYSYFYGEQSQSTEVTNLQEQPAESPSENLSASSANGCIQSENISADTPFFHNHIDDVDKRNIFVVSGGKSEEFTVFPAEKISVLLEEACAWAGKKPEKMNLFFKGEQLDVMKAVGECPGLRRGSKVHLIFAS
ncbi:hypothetical protein AMEX_G11349 [Astyanax mexicanus]|uniref:Ubiquitin-like domain-containing protein n=1 Tax=Astyanax mexicanus TaxID=7994 RepID=A0A8T2LU38_ASTMX|nr:hypothetical protein AMEX_G11349 [Astyanax mexicanus]